MVLRHETQGSCCFFRHVQISDTLQQQQIAAIEKSETHASHTFHANGFRLKSRLACHRHIKLSGTAQ